MTGSSTTFTSSWRNVAGKCSRNGVVPEWRRCGCSFVEPAGCSHPPCSTACLDKENLKIGHRSKTGDRRNSISSSYRPPGHQDNSLRYGVPYNGVERATVGLPVGLDCLNAAMAVIDRLLLERSCIASSRCSQPMAVLGVTQNDASLTNLV